MDNTNFNKIVATTIFASWWFPYLMDKDKFALILKLFMLIFVNDDHTECEYGQIAFNPGEAREVHSWTIGALKRCKRKEPFVAAEGAKPYSMEMVRVCDLICTQVNDEWRQRIIDGLIEFSEGCIEESERYQAKKALTYQEYMKVILYD